MHERISTNRRFLGLDADGGDQRVLLEHEKGPPIDVRRALDEWAVGKLISQ